jgi:hypothetical protein
MAKGLVPVLGEWLAECGTAELGTALGFARPVEARGGIQAWAATYAVELG